MRVDAPALQRRRHRLRHPVPDQASGDHAGGVRDAGFGDRNIDGDLTLREQGEAPIIPHLKEPTMATKDKNLHDLFHDTLKDIYYAEKQILKALPKMAKAAS